jgi:hypothetical protein
VASGELGALALPTNVLFFDTESGCVAESDCRWPDSCATSTSPSETGNVDEDEDDAMWSDAASAGVVASLDGDTIGVSEDAEFDVKIRNENLIW